MSLAAWGCWDDELDQFTLASLQAAYIRRQKWLARLRAVEIVAALNEALGGESGATGVSAGGRRYREVPLEGFMATMGTTWT